MLTDRTHLYHLISASLLVCAFSAQASAHGRDPIPRSFYLAKSGQETLNDAQALVSSNQGVHLTLDGGERWHWICEDILGNDVFAFAMAGDETDFRERTWLAGGIGLTQEEDPQEIAGVYLSSDGGCNWTPATGALEGQWAAQIRVHPENQDEILISTQHIDKVNGVAISEDRGESWSWTDLTIEGRISRRAIVVNALLRAPNDPDIVYASDAQGLYRSGDGGRTWEARDTGFIEQDIDEQQLILVDPDDPDRIFLAVFKPEGRLIYASEDAGVSFSLTHQAPTREPVTMAIFNKSALGRTLMLGSTFGTIYVSNDEGETWAESSSLAVECLVPSEDPASVFMCSNPYTQPTNQRFAIIKTDEALSINPWFSYKDTIDHIACDDDSQVNTVCRPLPNPDLDTYIPPDYGVADAGDANSLADAGDVGESLDAGADAFAEDRRTRSASAGCDGCDTVSAGTPSGIPWLALLVGVALFVVCFVRSRKDA